MNTKRLLRNTARRNNITVDRITGKKSMTLFGTDQYGFGVEIGAKVKRDEIVKFTYSNDSGTDWWWFDDLDVEVKVDNPRKFIQQVNRNEYFNTLVFSAQSFADELDSLRGVSSGEYSTYVSIGYDWAFA